MIVVHIENSRLKNFIFQYKYSRSAFILMDGVEKLLKTENVFTS